MSRTVPVALLPVGTRPLLQWCLTEALDAGFDEIGVVAREGEPLVQAYIESGAWRDGLLPNLAERAQAARTVVFQQARPVGVVDAVLRAGSWISEGDPFAVFHPDHVRIAGGPVVTAEHLAVAADRDGGVIGCHRVGPERRHYFVNAGRLELAEHVPAGRPPRVTSYEAPGGDAFETPPEGVWRAIPRYVVTEPWLDVARGVVAEAALTGITAAEPAVHRALAEADRLWAAPWHGTLVDAGHPVGALYAAHLLHEAALRERDDAEESPGSGLVSIDL